MINLRFWSGCVSRRVRSLREQRISNIHKFILRQRDAAIATKNKKDEPDFAASDCKARGSGMYQTLRGLLQLFFGATFVGSFAQWTSMEKKGSTPFFGLDE